MSIFTQAKFESPTDSPVDHAHLNAIALLAMFCLSTSRDVAEGSLAGEVIRFCKYSTDPLGSVIKARDKNNIAPSTFDLLSGGGKAVSIPLLFYWLHGAAMQFWATPTGKKRWSAYFLAQGMDKDAVATAVATTDVSQQVGTPPTTPATDFIRGIALNLLPQAGETAALLDNLWNTAKNMKAVFSAAGPGHPGLTRYSELVREVFTSGKLVWDWMLTQSSQGDTMLGRFASKVTRAFPGVGASAGSPAEYLDAIMGSPAYAAALGAPDAGGELGPAGLLTILTGSPYGSPDDVDLDLAGGQDMPDSVVMAAGAPSLIGQGMTIMNSDQTALVAAATGSLRSWWRKKHKKAGRRLLGLLGLVFSGVLGRLSRGVLGKRLAAKAGEMVEKGAPMTEEQFAEELTEVVRQHLREFHPELFSSGALPAGAPASRAETELGY